MLWAVHIPDGVLSPPWLVGGFVLAALLAAGAVSTDVLRDLLRTERFREETVAVVALLTAAFFVASLIHVKLGPTSVHLLLNGLVGVVLGWRAAVAIPAGLFLQAALMGHGGFTTLGVNSCVLVLPALLAWVLFDALRRLPWVQQPLFRATLVTGSVVLWTLSLVYSLALVASNRVGPLPALDTTWADQIAFHPATLGAALLLGALAAWVERRLGNAPEFPLGLLVGEVAVMATAFLNFVVLRWGGEEDWHTLALLTFVAHLPIAVIEGIVLGFVVGFLARVKPELLGWSASPGALAALAPLPCPAPAGSRNVTLSNGRTAHAAPIPPALPCSAPELAGAPDPGRPGAGAPP